MWNIIFYEKENGQKPVQEFLDALPAKHSTKAVWEIKLLEDFGICLGMPYARHLQGKLWELRVKFASDISRIFYFIPVGNNIILLHGFTKKSPETPREELNMALAHLVDYERRFSK